MLINRSRPRIPHGADGRDCTVQRRKIRQAGVIASRFAGSALAWTSFLVEVCSLVKAYRVYVSLHFFSFYRLISSPSHLPIPPLASPTSPIPPHPLSPLPLPFVLPFSLFLYSIPLPFYLLSRLLDLHRWLRQILFPARMRPLLTLRPIRTKPSEIKRTQYFTDVFLAAIRPQRAKPLFVVRTRRKFRRRIDMQINAFVAIGAEKGARVIDAFLHLAQIVLMREIAAFALFTEPAKPMLAYQGAMREGNGVFVWAAAFAKGAVAFTEGFAVGLA